MIPARTFVYATLAAVGLSCCETREQANLELEATVEVRFAEIAH